MTKQKIVTSELRKKAKKNGISIDTVYRRIKRGIHPELACSVVSFRGNDHDWENEIYALYKGDEFVVDGNIYEIAKFSGKSVNTLKFYTYDCHNKRSKGNHLTMEYLGKGEDYE